VAATTIGAIVDSIPDLPHWVSAALKAVLTVLWARLGYRAIKARGVEQTFPAVGVVGDVRDVGAAVRSLLLDLAGLAEGVVDDGAGRVAAAGLLRLLTTVSQDAVRMAEAAVQAIVGRLVRGTTGPARHP
jgi:hypothetical protein